MYDIREFWVRLLSLSHTPTWQALSCMCSGWGQTHKTLDCLISQALKRWAANFLALTHTHPGHLCMCVLVFSVNGCLKCSFFFKSLCFTKLYSWLPVFVLEYRDLILYMKLEECLFCYNLSFSYFIDLKQTIKIQWIDQISKYLTRQGRQGNAAVSSPHAF